MSQKKFIVTVQRAISPQQIEDFPEGCERSVEGALHVKPGTLELTEDELKHIRKHHKDVARRLHVAREVDKPKAAKAELKPKAEPEPQPDAPKAKEDKSKKGKSK